jgi:hypothetical protein
MVIVAGPMFRRTPVVISLALGFSIGILAPWVAELAGWISPTTLVASDHITLVPHHFSAGPFQVESALTLYGPLLVIVATIWAVGFARSEDNARRQLHLQAWRLRQLVT